MNERRHNRQNYLNVGEPIKQESVNNLLAQIIYFNTHNKTAPADFIALDAIVKQLAQSKSGLPRKVLRSMQNKFEVIQGRYQNR